MQTLLAPEMLTTAVFIFSARVLDVSLGTIRIAVVSRGARKLAPLIGFFEILCWLGAVGKVIGNLDQPLHYVAFAGGFATGTWLGLVIEERLGFGLYAVRIITGEDARALTSRLSALDIGLTNFAARGLKGHVRLIFSVIRRRDLQKVLSCVRSVDPMAFVSVSDVRLAQDGYLWRPTPDRSGFSWWARKK